MTSLEPMADVVFAISEIHRLLPRLSPARDAFKRLNQAHQQIKELEQEVAYWKARAK